MAAVPTALLRRHSRGVAVALATATVGFGLWGLVPALDQAPPAPQALAPNASTRSVDTAAWTGRAEAAVAATQAQIDAIDAAQRAWNDAVAGRHLAATPTAVGQLAAQRQRLLAQQTLLRGELADAASLPAESAQLADLQSRLSAIAGSLAGPAGTGQQAANEQALAAQRDAVTAQIAALHDQVGSLTTTVAQDQQAPLPNTDDVTAPTVQTVLDLAQHPGGSPTSGPQDDAPSPQADPQYPSSPEVADASTGAPPRDPGSSGDDGSGPVQALGHGVGGVLGQDQEALDSGPANGGPDGSSGPVHLVADAQQAAPSAVAGTAPGGTPTTPGAGIVRLVPAATPMATPPAAAASQPAGTTAATTRTATTAKPATTTRTTTTQRSTTRTTGPTSGRTPATTTRTTTTTTKRTTTTTATKKATATKPTPATPTPARTSTPTTTSARKKPAGTK